jgi:uncharacterized repeat protein (TIGR04052 family)
MTKISIVLGIVASAALSFGACDDTDSADDDTDAGQLTTDAGTDGGTDAGRDAGLDAGATIVDAAVDASAPRQAITLHFKGKVGTQDLACGQSYPGQGSTSATITPRDFRFFVHDVRLISATGAEVPVLLDERLPYQSTEITLIDFADGTGSCDPSDKGTNTLVTGTVPVGSYTGVAFVEGVPETLNHADPALHPGPLQASGVSWGWTLGFRFVMAEVVATSSAGDAGGHSNAPIAPPPDAGVADAGSPAQGGGLGFVHLGSTGCTGTQASDDAGPGVSCDKPNRPEVRFTTFNPVSSAIVADLGAVFSTADLSESVQCHGSGPACAPMFEALGVDLDTGAALPTQHVFRVE